jgi:predicted metal-dependent phosphoesterase TrpH
MTAGRWRLPLFFSGLVLLSQAFPLPSPVRDAATLEWARGFHLVYPLGHIVFSPFCGIADLLTVLSVHQMYVFVAYILVLCIWFGIKKGPVFFVLFVAFVAWGALVPRPMGRLTADDPAVFLVDFHSHSQYSHDGRRSFTPEANMRWHEQQGYEAAFITDHNRIEASHAANEISKTNWTLTGYRSLQGEEVSLQKTHLVILGNHARVDNRPYDGWYNKIRTFVNDMHQKGFIVIASLPEYWLYHWGDDVQDFVRWGMDGFEIINSAPKALDFPLADRLQIVELCRQHHLFMTGISDNHGYGYATATWNAVRLDDDSKSPWRSLSPEELERAVIRRLKRGGFAAVQVLERVKFFPDVGIGLLINPLGNLWIYWRSLQPLQSLSWMLWIWIVCFLYRPRR